MVTLALTLSLVVSAADLKPEAWVVVTKRSGVSKAAALDLARTLSETLAAKGVPTAKTPGDLTSCNAKLPCLVREATKNQVGMLVTVEAGSVLDDVLVHADALSVDDDGKKVASWDFEGKAARFDAEAKARVDAQLVPAIKKALGLGAPPPPPPAVTPPPAVVATAPVTVEPPPPAPPVVQAPPTVKTEAESAGMSGGRIAGLVVGGVGVAALATGAVFGIMASSNNAQRLKLCPADAACNNPQAFTLYNTAASQQNLSTAMLIGGGVLAAAGVTLFILDLGGGSTVQAAPQVGTEGAGVTLFGRF
jgi:hypothetical protein